MHIKQVQKSLPLLITFVGIKKRGAFLNVDLFFYELGSEGKASW